MPDNSHDPEPKSVNRRNLTMVLGALAALLLIANVGEGMHGIFSGDDYHESDNDAEFDAAVEELVEGDSHRFLEYLDNL